jgi:hypothetical protein
MKKTIYLTRSSSGGFLRWLTMVFLLIAGTLFSSNLSAQTVTTITASGSFTVPPGVTSIQGVFWGGGGGGAGTNSSGVAYLSSGGGGGAACVVTGSIAVTPGDVYTITVGAGGAGTSTTGTAGGNGGTTTITGPAGTWTAGGGFGGVGANSAAPTGGSNAGGAGATVGTGTGIVVYSGGSGSAGYNGTGSADGVTGNGGGAGGSSSNGTTPTMACGVSAAGGTGTYPGGAGAVNATCSTTSTDIAGTAGSIPGGGGAGTKNWNSGTVAGGAGARGQVILIYTLLPCTAPTTQASAVVLTPTSPTAMNGSFTGAAGSVTGYLVVRYPSGASTTNPTDGVNYTVGNAIGAGTVVQSSASTVFTASGLSQATAYDIYVYSYNSTPGSCSIAYFNAGPATATATTPACSDLPTAQPTALVITPVSAIALNGSFTAAAGAPNGYLVVRYPAGTGVITPPATSVSYSAGNTLGLGTVVQSSSATTFSATGLTQSTSYDFYVYSYTTTGTCGLNYLAAAPLSGSGTTPACPTASGQPVALTLTPIYGAQINGSFSPALGATGYLVVRYLSGASVSNPIQGTTYTAGGTLGSGTVVQAGTATTFSATGLSVLTGYDFYVYSYTSGVCPISYLTASPLTGTASTPGNAIPTCPTTYTPTSGATGVAVSQVLSWSGQLGIPSIIAYDVYLSSNFAAVSGLLPSALIASNVAATS